MISLKNLLLALSKTTPVGTVQAYAGTTVPSGWLECNGQAVSRTTYANLFSAIGTTYGSGNGSTTFNVPNLQGRFPQGAGTLDSQTYTVGDEKSAGVPNITASAYMGWKDSSAAGIIGLSSSGAFYTTSGTAWFAWPDYSGTYPSTLNFNASRSSDVYGNSSTVQPNALVLKYIIWGGYSLTSILRGWFK